MSARSDPPVSTTAQSARRGSWFITFMLVTILIGGAAVWRFKNDQSNLKTDTDMHLPRTQALVSQKIGSLTTYNQPVSEEELIDFYAQVVQGRQVEADVFTTLSRWVTDRLLPELWRDSQALESSATLITHEAVWFDMNNDGLLDVYTANFGDWLNGDVPTLGRINTNGGPNRLLPLTN